MTSSLKSIHSILITVSDDPFSVCTSEGTVRRPPWLLKALQSDPSSQRLDVEACGVNSELADAMLNIRILAQRYPTPAACEDASVYQDTMSLLTATMNAVLAFPGPTDPTTHQARITAACRYALTAHVFALWCDDNSDNKAHLPSLTPLHHQPGKPRTTIIQQDTLSTNSPRSIPPRLPLAPQPPDNPAPTASPVTPLD